VYRIDSGRAVEITAAQAAKPGGLSLSGSNELIAVGGGLQYRDAMPAAVSARFSAEFPGLLPDARDLLPEALHAWLHPRDPNWIDQDGKLLWCGDVATVGFGSQSGTSLADLASRDRGFLEWILRKDFSDEVKGIVRAALDGRLPVREG
jgi:hypothetical protein